MSSLPPHLPIATTASRGSAVPSGRPATAIAYAAASVSSASRDSAAIVGSRPRPPVRSAAAMRNSAIRYAVRSAGTVGGPSPVESVELEVPSALGGSPVLPVASTRHSSGLATRWSPSADDAPSTATSRRRSPASLYSASSTAPVAAFSVMSSLGPVTWPPLPRTAARPADSMIRCSWRSARLGSAARDSALDQLGGVGVHRPLRLGVPQPQPGRAEQVGGPGAVVGEAVPGEPAGPGHLLAQQGQACAAGARARDVGVRQGAQRQRGEPGRERLPHLLDVGQDVGGRGRPPRPRRSPARPARRRPTRAQAAIIATSHSMWNCRPQARSPSRNAWCGYRVEAASRTALSGSSVISSRCHWITSGSSGTYLNSGSLSAASRRADQAGTDLRAGGAAFHQAAVRRREQLRRPGRPPAWVRGGGPPCAAAPPAPGTTAAPGSPAGSG